MPVSCRVHAGVNEAARLLAQRSLNSRAEASPPGPGLASGACRAGGFGIGIGTGIGAGLLQNTIQALLSDDTLRATLSLFLVGFPLKISGLADFVCCLCKCSSFPFLLNSPTPLPSLIGDHIPLIIIFLLLGRAPRNSALNATMGPWSQLPWSCVLLSTFITPSLGAVITARPGSASVVVVPELPGACRAVIS